MLETPIDKYNREVARYKRVSLYISLIGVFLGLTQLIFLLKYVKIIFAFKEATLLDAIMSSIALVNPFIFIGTSIVFYFFFSKYGDVKALKVLFKELSS